jgi:hypothetical protein
MNLDRVNRWLTLAANIGVIAGIAFLGIELQQNNRLSAAQAEVNLLQYEMSFAAPGFESQAVAEFMVNMRAKARSGEELSEVEQFRVRRLLDQKFAGWEWQYLQNRAGTLNDMGALRRSLESNFERPDFLAGSAQEFRTYWNQFAERGNPEFVEFVESVTGGQ